MSDQSESDNIPKFPPLSISGSDRAPFVFFDASSAWGYNDGAVIVSVEAVRMVSGAPGPRPVIDRVIVAHLRTTVSGAIALRDALNNAILMSAADSSLAKN